MNEMFTLSFVLITVHYNIYKVDTSLHFNNFPYVQISVNVTEDFLSKTETCGIRLSIDYYMEFMFC
jgi:hypothetical protein